MSRKWLPEAITLLFPKNQYNEKALQIAREVGFSVFRVHPNSFLYKTSSTKLWIRGAHLLDTYLPNSHHQFVERSEETMSYSRFLRPAEKFEFLRRRKLDCIKQSMSVAAMTGRDYHLYFHPHNLTKRTQDAFNDLEEILEHFQVLKREKGMQSVTLREYLRK